MLNADDYYGAEAFRRIHGYLEQQKPQGDKLDLCMAGYLLGNTLSEVGAVTRGLCRAGRDGKLKELVETKGIVVEDDMPCVPGPDGMLYELDASALVSMNIWGMPASFIDYLEEGFAPFLSNLGDDALTAEYLLPTIVGGMIQKGRGEVQVLPTGDKWFGMTYAEDKRQTQEKIRELIALGAYPEKL